MATEHSLSAGAARSRRYRERLRKDVRLISVPVAPESLYALVARGFLAEENKDDQTEISVAIQILLNMLSNNELWFDADKD